MKDPFSLRKESGGIIAVSGKVYADTETLPLIYTPGVGEISKAVAHNPELAYECTFKRMSVAVISDGSAVLGLGNIGPYGALPVMEGKALLFKQLADIDAVPICLDTQDPDEIVETIVKIAPVFGGINLEDIEAPKCFRIEEALKRRLSIPVVHDDQHGTAVVVLAGLYNALYLKGVPLESARIVINGAGAAGSSVLQLLVRAGATRTIICDSKGIISKQRELTPDKMDLVHISNPDNMTGTLADALAQADVFIGLSKAGLLTAEMVATMSKDPIVFALANPVPEIFPEEAKEAGALIVATGRSDFHNQINNALAFPGIFRGALLNRTTEVTDEHFVRAARALADLIPNPTPEKIIPSIFDSRVVDAVASVFDKNL